MHISIYLCNCIYVCLPTDQLLRQREKAEDALLVDEVEMTNAALTEKLVQDVGTLFDVQVRSNAKIASVVAVSSGGRVPLPRGPGSIGVGQIQNIMGNVDIWIPAGGSAGDALLFVADYSAKEVKVFNACSGALVRSITGNGKGSGTGQFNCAIDVHMASTGPNREWELFVSDVSNNVVMVLNPMTGEYIRQIGSGQGAGAGQLNNPYGLLVQTPLVSGGDYLLFPPH